MNEECFICTPSRMNSLLKIVSILDVILYASTEEEYQQLKVINSGVRYGCSKCFKTYCQKKTLGRHLRLDCGKSPSFICQICEKKFKHGYLLLKHIRQSHNIHIENLRQRGTRLPKVVVDVD